MPSDDKLSDDYVATLLAKDAKDRSIKYSSYGLGAFLPKRPTTNAPKPNTRFLKNIIKETDSHNAALKAREAEEAKARLRKLRGDARRDSGRQATDEDGRPSKRRRVGEEYDDGVIRKGRGHKINDQRDVEHFDRDERRKNRTRYEYDTSDSQRAERSHRHRHHREGRRRRSRSHQRSRGDANKHRGRRERSYSRSRSGERSEHRSRRHNDHRRVRSRSRSRSRSPTLSRYRRRRRSPSISSPPSEPAPLSKRPSAAKNGTNPRPETINGKPKRPRSPSPSSSSDSDPLASIVGPPPPPSPPKVRSRGRGARTSKAGIDDRFSSNYNPTMDIQPNSDSEDDWDQALEALHDRQKWKQQGADRLRQAGFTEQEVQKWEKSGPSGEKREEDVVWKREGEGREWDRGKVVTDDGDEVVTRAEWGRLI